MKINSSNETNNQILRQKSQNTEEINAFILSNHYCHLWKEIENQN
jgi:hypothetical protein